MVNKAQRYAIGAGNGFNKYAAGAKRYGAAGRSMPTVGPVDKSGYRERDTRIAARKQALLKEMQAKAGGRYASPEALRPRVRKAY